MNQEHVMRRSFAVNTILILAKIASGLVFSSVALIADGVHSISDLMTDVFVILGIRHSKKPADEEHPFGHGKFEYVLSLFLGLAITLIAYNLGKQVIVDWNVIPGVPRAITLLVVVVVIGVKLILARYLIRQGEALDSEIVRASGAESFSDVISSAVVFVGIAGVLLGDAYGIDWLLYGDKVASVLIALFIIRIGILIVWQAIQSLQGKKANPAIALEYLACIQDIDGVLKVDHLDLISYGPYYQAIVDIRVDGAMSVKAGHDIAERVEAALMNNEKICHVSVHVNPGGPK
jgi:cation diffusion facilitator family transporter